MDRMEVGSKEHDEKLREAEGKAKFPGTLCSRIRIWLTASMVHTGSRAWDCWLVELDVVRGPPNGTLPPTQVKQ